MLPYSFSQNSPGPLPWSPEIEPQNIQPIFLCTFGSTQSLYRASPRRRVTLTFLCLPGWIHVSSVQMIWDHCSSVQLMWSRAHASRICACSGVNFGFLRAVRRANPSFLNAVAMAYTLQSQPRIAGISDQDVRRFLPLAYTQSTNCFLSAGPRSGYRPECCFFEA